MLNEWNNNFKVILRIAGKSEGLYQVSYVCVCHPQNNKQIETAEGREFLSETRQAKDHAIRLIERWTEASLDPLFGQINQLNEQVCVL